MRGIIEPEVQERLKAHVTELLEDPKKNICLQQDRDFIVRMKKYMSSTKEFMFARRITVAEANRISVIYSNYVAYVRNKNYGNNT